MAYDDSVLDRDAMIFLSEQIISIGKIIDLGRRRPSSTSKVKMRALTVFI